MTVNVLNVTCDIIDRDVWVDNYNHILIYRYANGYGITAFVQESKTRICSACIYIIRCNNEKYYKNYRDQDLLSLISDD